MMRTLLAALCGLGACGDIGRIAVVDEEDCSVPAALGTVSTRPPAWYADGDGDGAGDPDVWTRAWVAPPGFVDNDLDCDDTTVDRAPGNREVCDGVDNDCDRQTDEGAEGAPACLAGSDSGSAGRVSWTPAPLVAWSTGERLQPLTARGTLLAAPAGSSLVGGVFAREHLCADAHCVPESS